MKSETDPLASLYPSARRWLWKKSVVIQTVVVRDQLSVEQTLAHASELLHCASVTAYKCGDSLKGGQRHMAFAVLHLVQMATAMVDKSLDRCSSR